jgi:hypothetical protein
VKEWTDETSEINFRNGNETEQVEQRISELDETWLNETWKGLE